MLIDTHCHLYDEAFRDDFDAVLARAREAGLEACVMPGIDDAQVAAAREKAVAQKLGGRHRLTADEYIEGILIAINIVIL